MRNNKAKLIIAIPTAVIFFLLLVVLIFIPENRFWTKSESACMQNNKGIVSMWVKSLICTPILMAWFW